VNSILFSSFGEFASKVLGIRSPRSVLHIPWTQKIPIATVSSVPSVQAPMAYRFVDPTPFMPHGAQRLMIPGRPLMKRVVTSPVHERNNDVAIAIINPLPQHHIGFDEIRNILVAFLNAHNIPISQYRDVLLVRHMCVLATFIIEIFSLVVDHTNLGMARCPLSHIIEPGIIELPS
jgi:hypothetical protein